MSSNFEASIQSHPPQLNTERTRRESIAHIGMYGAIGLSGALNGWTLTYMVEQTSYFDPTVPKVLISSAAAGGLVEIVRRVMKGDKKTS